MIEKLQHIQGTLDVVRDKIAILATERSSNDPMECHLLDMLSSLNETRLHTRKLLQELQNADST